MKIHRKHHHTSEAIAGDTNTIRNARTYRETPPSKPGTNNNHLGRALLTDGYRRNRKHARPGNTGTHTRNPHATATRSARPWRDRPAWSTSGHVALPKIIFLSRVSTGGQRCNAASTNRGRSLAKDDSEGRESARQGVFRRPIGWPRVLVDSRTVRVALEPVSSAPFICLAALERR